MFFHGRSEILGKPARKKLERSKRGVILSALGLSRLRPEQNQAIHETSGNLVGGSSG
jgi:hypothetical protein